MSETLYLRISTQNIACSRERERITIYTFHLYEVTGPSDAHDCTRNTPVKFRSLFTHTFMPHKSPACGGGDSSVVRAPDS